jgi:hypothetical protein
MTLRSRATGRPATVQPGKDDRCCLLRIRCLRPAAVIDFDQEWRPPIRPGPDLNPVTPVLITDEVDIVVICPVTHDQPLDNQPRDPVPQFVQHAIERPASPLAGRPQALAP